MLKRTLSILCILALMLTGLVPAAMAAGNGEMSDEAPAGSGMWYVYTENGKGLNVRRTPGGDVVGSLKYGSHIYVDAFINENWALITYRYNNPGYGMGDWAAFVNRRFLTRKKPAPRGSAATAAPAAASPMEELNAEYRSAVKVDSYKVTVRPARVTGWAVLRWGPSDSTELLATYKANAQLLVLKETDHWLQVQDPDTGDVGFINRDYVVQ